MKEFDIKEKIQEQLQLLLDSETRTKEYENAHAKLGELSKIYSLGIFDNSKSLK